MSGRQAPSYRLPPLFFLFLFITLPTFAAAQQGHLTLLTVAESEDPAVPIRGGTADLYLEVKPGTGQIFIDSFPLTRLDTQASTRYANRVACDYTGEDCAAYDFFYTIKADSVVVGGPSAGGAIAVLTALLLRGEEPDERVALTGTINSGGIIGPVAGLKEKVLAARERGLEKVLISAFSTPTTLNKSYLAELNKIREANGSGLNLSRLYVPVNLSTLGVEVVRVATLDEAISVFTGKEPGPTPPLSVDPAYSALMLEVATSLCDRREGLARSLAAINASVNATANFSRHAAAAISRGDWYSLASYCFADLVTLRGEAFSLLTPRERKAKRAELLRAVNSFEQGLSRRNLTTLAELEASMIVAERLREARQALLRENRSNVSPSVLGFALERYNSARAWSAFFTMKSRPVTLDREHLRTACNEKLVEAEERIEYVLLSLPPELLAGARETLNAASEDGAAGRYPLCLFRASKAQALADLFAGSLSVSREKVEPLVRKKLDAAAVVISRQEERGFFPIIGYSYYQYASNLAAHDPYSALTFAEYALELSNLALYFPREEGFRFPSFQWYALLLFLSGVLLGFALGILSCCSLLKKREGLARRGPSRFGGRRGRR